MFTQILTIGLLLCLRQDASTDAVRSIPALSNQDFQAHCNALKLRQEEDAAAMFAEYSYRVTTIKDMFSSAIRWSNATSPETYSAQDERLSTACREERIQMLIVAQRALSDAETEYFKQLSTLSGHSLDILKFIERDRLHSRASSTGVLEVKAPYLSYPSLCELLGTDGANPALKVVGQYSDPIFSELTTLNSYGWRWRLDLGNAVADLRTQLDETGQLPDQAYDSAIRVWNRPKLIAKTLFVLQHRMLREVSQLPIYADRTELYVDLNRKLLQNLDLSVAHDPTAMFYKLMNRGDVSPDAQRQLRDLWSGFNQERAKAIDKMGQEFIDSLNEDRLSSGARYHLSRILGTPSKEPAEFPKMAAEGAEQWRLVHSKYYELLNSFVEAIVRSE